MIEVAFFDIDKTIINDSSLISFIIFLAEQKYFSISAKYDIRSIKEAYLNKELTYEEYANKIMDNLAYNLKGKSKKKLTAFAYKFWDVIKPKVAFWAKDLISLFNKSGFKTIAISGSINELVNIYKEKLGFQDIFATEFEVLDDIYTGKILVHRSLDKEKEKVFFELIKKEKINLANSYGFGDNHHDRAFLDRVGNPVVIRSEDTLYLYAQKKSWMIFSFNLNVYEGIKAKLNSRA